MKQTSITVLFLTVALFAFGQKEGRVKERIETFKIAFFTQQLDLTAEEAKAFWPIYNEYQKEIDALHDELHKHRGENFDNLSDKELEKLVEKRFEVEQKKLDTEKRYYLKFKKVLPMKKVAKLPHVEKSFKQALLRKMQEKRGGGKAH